MIVFNPTHRGIMTNPTKVWYKILWGLLPRLHPSHAQRSWDRVRALRCLDPELVFALPLSQSLALPQH